MRKHKTKRTEDGHLYRGFNIYRDDSITPGYYGRYYTFINRHRRGFSSLQDAMFMIDMHLDTPVTTQ